MGGHGDWGAIRTLTPVSREDAIRVERWGRVLWTDGKYHVWWSRRQGTTSLCGIAGGTNINYGLFGFTEADKCKRCQHIIAKAQGDEGE